MRKVICYCDFNMRGPGVYERTKAFQQLCNLMMLLGVWDVTELRDITWSQTGNKKIWSIDWKQQMEYIRNRNLVAAHFSIKQI